MEKLSQSEMTRITNGIEKVVPTGPFSADEAAEALLQVNEIENVLETVKAKLADKIKTDAKPGWKRLFVETKQKVVLQEGANKTEVDNMGLYIYLSTLNRPHDFVKVASVTQTALREKLNDGETLIAKFVKTIGQNKPSVQVKDMSKDDLKEVGLA